jgi:hypothetical protein
MRERGSFDIWCSCLIVVFAVLIVAGIVLPRSEAQTPDRPDGTIVINKVDDLVPGDWGLLDDLAFNLYSGRLNEISLARTDIMDTSIEEAYKRAHYFLKNMEKVRKPYIEGTQGK